MCPKEMYDLLDKMSKNKWHYDIHEIHGSLYKKPNKWAALCGKKVEKPKNIDDGKVKEACLNKCATYNAMLPDQKNMTNSTGKINDRYHAGLHFFMAMVLYEELIDKLSYLNNILIIVEFALAIKTCDKKQENNLMKLQKLCHLYYRHLFLDDSINEISRVCFQKKFTQVILECHIPKPLVEPELKLLKKSHSSIELIVDDPSPDSRRRYSEDDIPKIGPLTPEQQTLKRICEEIADHKNLLAQKRDKMRSGSREHRLTDHKSYAMGLVLSGLEDKFFYDKKKLLEKAKIDPVLTNQREWSGLLLSYVSFGLFKSKTSKIIQAALDSYPWKEQVTY